MVNRISMVDLFVSFLSIIRTTPQITRSISIAQPPSSQSEPSKPWSILATSPSTTTAMAYSSIPIASSPPPISFKYIQDQEARAHEALRQISNKSLETIQVRFYNRSSFISLHLFSF